MSLDKFFHITPTGSTVKTEITAGITTFLMMSYIVFVNPTILANAGMDKGSVFTATVIAAAFSTILMGLYANWPLALAPGMGTNSWFTYGVVLGMGYSWQVALGAVFISGLLFIILTLLPVRKAIIELIPHSLKMALASGIGFFIIFMGLRTSGLIVSNPATLLSLGDLSKPSAYLTLLGLFIILFFESRKIKGSVILSIIIISAIAYFMGLTTFTGILSLPPSLSPTFMQLDVRGALSMGLVTIVLSFFLIDFFNSTAVFVGIMGATQKFIPEANMKKALLVDAVATSAGAVLGVSPITTFSESATGVVQGGGRTGLVAVTIGVLFLFMIFLSPILTLIPLFATAPAMIYISCMMFKNFQSIEWDDITELLPAFLTIAIIPLTSSIFNGIGIGIISWIIMKILYKKWTNKHWPLLIIAGAYILHLTL